MKFITKPKAKCGTVLIYLINEKITSLGITEILGTISRNKIKTKYYQFFSDEICRNL